MGISLCMIVKNSENTLEKCLDSVCDIVDEIVIVDTGSTDNTVSIAKKYTDKVFFEKWNNDFSQARNVSKSYAKEDLIFWMDDDDVLTEDARNDLLAIRSHNDMNAAYYFTIYNTDCVSYAQLYDNNYPHLRVFPNRKDIVFSGKIHEEVLSSIEKIPSIELRMLSSKINHCGYNSKENLDKSLLRNIKIQLLESISKSTGIENYPVLYEFVENNLICFYIPNTLFAYTGYKLYDSQCVYKKNMDGDFFNIPEEKREEFLKGLIKGIDRSVSSLEVLCEEIDRINKLVSTF